MRIKPAGKIAILIIVIGVLFGGYQFLNKSGMLPGAVGKESVVPTGANLPNFTPSGEVTVSNIGMPADSPAGTGKEVRWLHWAWNAQMGLMFANGGKETTKGSLMAAQGINVKFTRQDDVSKMQEALVTFATELSKGNPDPKNGAHFVTIMGDGGAAFLAGLNDALGKLGPEYKAKIVGVAGFSHGEDKFMGPPEWKKNPRSAMGGVCAAYLRDGDWNIVQKWLGDNGLKTNPDEKTYDPDAMNWVAANDYVDAAEKYIAGYSEERPVVRNGKLTGEKKRITVQSVATWTPADVTVAEKKGGIISIVSTKEYASQMPCVIIGIDKWMKANKETVQGLIKAVLLGNEAVRGNPDALRKAADISAVVYNEQGADGSYWEKYYKGVTQKDRQGLDVELGGSSVVTLAEELQIFGLVPGSQNVVQATYTVFGDIAKSQYPNLMPHYPPPAEAIDTTYVMALASAVNPNTGGIKPVEPPIKDRAAKPGDTIGQRNWKITFETGRAAFTGNAGQELRKLLNDLLVASNTFVEIHGHTDSVGNSEANMKLSEDRAFAVKKWLEQQAPSQMEGRLRVFAHGQTEPIESNSTDAGRSANRRVEIKIRAVGE